MSTVIPYNGATIIASWQGKGAILYSVPELGAEFETIEEARDAIDGMNEPTFEDLYLSPCDEGGGA